MARAMQEASRNALMEYLPEHMVSTLELLEMASANTGAMEFQLDTLQKVVDELNKEG